MVHTGLATSSATLLATDLGRRVVGLAGDPSTGGGLVKVRARAVTWSFDSSPTPPAVPLDAGQRTVQLNAFARHATQGAIWTAILLWGADDLVAWSPLGANLRSASQGLISKAALRNGLVAPTTRDFHLAMTGGRRRPLSVLDLQRAYRRIFATARATQAVAEAGVIFSEPDPSAADERALAAAKGNVPAITDAAAACRRASEAVRVSALQESPSPSEFLTVVADVNAAVAESDELEGAVHRAAAPTPIS